MQRPQPAPAPAGAGPERWYPWLVVSAIFLTMALDTGSAAAIGVFIPYMAQDLGWSRATISGAVAFSPLMYGLLQPVLGWLVGRVPPLLILAAGGATVGSALVLTRYVTEPWHLAVTYGFLAGAGLSASTLLVGSTLVNTWFSSRRGLALGIAASGLAVGRLVLVPLAGGLILVQGWRVAWSTLGLMLLAGPVLSIGLYLWRRRTTDASAGNIRPVAMQRIWLRNGSFWKLAGSFVVCGFTVHLVSTHLPGLALERGLSATIAASALGLAGGLATVGTVGAGWLSDFMSQRYLLALTYFIRAVGLAGLMFAHDPALFIGMTALAGTTFLLTGNVTVGLASRKFGTAQAPLIFGYSFLGHQVAGAVSILLGGLSYDLTYTYTWAFWLCVVLLLVASALVLGFQDRVKRTGPAPAGPVPPYGAD